MRKKSVEKEKPVEIEEVNALIKYASENGILPEGNTIGELIDAISEYECSTTENQASKSDDAVEDFEKNKCNTNQTSAIKDILLLYTKLNAAIIESCSKSDKITYCPNGRTLIDTKTWYKRQARFIIAWGILFMLLAFGTEALDLWFADIVEPEEGPLLFLINFHRYFLDNFSPFFWGALGSCVFLMKRLSDMAADRGFDSKKWRGWGTRILLGAILGTVVVYMFDSESFTANEINLGANAIAFFTGVSVKVIYGAIEKLIDVIADKFSISKK